MTPISQTFPTHIKTLQAVEFETVVLNRTIQIPDDIPDGLAVRVLLLIDAATASNASGNSKQGKSLLSDEESRS